ncbi:MAG: aminoacyl-tRNA hydrolase [Clostridia bacterium]
MYIVVGLGNPGREYAYTRHNMGFMTLDLLSAKYNIDIKRNNYRAICGEGFIASKKVILAKPQTFMNLSGFSVMDLMNFYKCEHGELIVVYDDIDLAIGDIRIREKGSAGTHNGMRSVIGQLGYDDFPRIRVGIGKASDGRELFSHVLAIPSDEEKIILNEALNHAADAIELIIGNGVNEAQAKFNKKPHQKKNAEPEVSENTPDS